MGVVDPQKEPLPGSFGERMRILLGDENAMRFFRAMERPPLKSIRINRSRIPREEIDIVAPDSAPVPWYSPWGRILSDGTRPSTSLKYLTGDYYIQERSAMLCIAALESVFSLTGQRVLDIAASPGGKATQAGELAKSGVVVANEVIKGRLPPLVWNVIRHRLTNVVVLSRPLAEISAAMVGWFDALIADVPCTGEGLIMKGKLDPASLTQSDVEHSAARQKTILKDAAPALKTGGMLAYATCTFAREENEQQSAMLLAEMYSPVPFPQEFILSPALTDDLAVAACSRRIWPHVEGGTGAYVSLMRKNGPELSADTRITSNRDAQKGKRDALHIQPSNEGIVSHRTDWCLDAVKPLGLIDSGKVGNRGCGYLFERNGTIILFSLPEIPKYLFTNAEIFGLAVAAKRGDRIEPLHGSIMIAKDEARLELAEDEAMAYMEGKQLRTGQPNVRGYRFASFNGEILGLAKCFDGKGNNLLPIPLRMQSC